MERFPFTQSGVSLFGRLNYLVRQSWICEPCSLNLTDMSSPCFASLLQPRSYASSHSHSSGSRQTPVMHSQDTIRDNTMQLSNMIISPLSAGRPSSLQVRESIILSQLDHGVKAPDDMKRISTSAPQSKTSAPSDHSPNLSPTTPPPSNGGGISTTWRRENFRSTLRPSGLSLLLAGEGRTRPSQQDKPTQPTTSAEIESHASIPTVEVSEHSPSVTAQETGDTTDITPPGEREYSTHDDFTETAPLLGSSHPTYTPPAATPEACGRTGMDTSVSHYIRNVLKPVFIRHVVTTAVKSLPSVLLGSLLNILDGVSCESLQILRLSGSDNIADGMIIFPATGVFDDLGGMGVSIFFVTYVHNSCYTQESEQITDFVTSTALSSPS
jgi:hypothetical protein